MKDNKIKIVIGVDHRAYQLKEFLIQKKAIAGREIAWIDVGTYSEERTDYPIFAHEAVKRIKNKEADLGILSCGTGIGMAITANRYKNIYAGLVWNKEISRLAKEDDNINVLVLPSDFISFDEVLECINEWLSVEFKGDRYQHRLNLIDNIL